MCTISEIHIDKLSCFPTSLETVETCAPWIPTNTCPRIRCDVRVFLMLLALLKYSSSYDKEQSLFLPVLYFLRILVEVQHTWSTKNDVLTAQGATINFTVLSEYVISLSVQVCPLPAEPLIGGWWYWFTYCSGHSISSINTPASHEGDTATKILNPLLLILSRTQK